MEEALVNLTIEEKKPEVKQVTEEAADEITIKKKVFVDEEEQKVTLKKKKPQPKPQPEAEVAAEFRIEQKPEEVPGPEDTETSFDMKVKPKEEVTEASFLVEQTKIEEESVEAVISEERKAPTVVEDSDQMKLIIEDVKEATTEEETDEVIEQYLFIATTTYISEMQDGLTIVEGEKVRVIEKTSTDHWLVRKVLTKESGLVPPDILKEAEEYTHYLKETLEEKIQRLPTFGRKLGLTNKERKTLSERNLYFYLLS